MVRFVNEIHCGFTPHDFNCAPFKTARFSSVTTVHIISRPFARVLSRPFASTARFLSRLIDPTRSLRQSRRVPSSLSASSVAFAPRGRGSRTHLYRFFHRDRRRVRRHRARFVARAIVRSIAHSPMAHAPLGLRDWAPGARRRATRRRSTTRARDDARGVDDDARDRGGARGARPARRSRESEDADADG